MSKKIEKKAIVTDKYIYVVNPGLVDESIDNTEEMRRSLAAGFQNSGEHFTFQSLKDVQASEDLADMIAVPVPIFEVTIKKIGMASREAKVITKLDKRG